MRKVFYVGLVLMLHTMLYADIACESSDVCPAGMYCSPDSVCALDPNTKASYAEISVALGEQTPGLHANALYLSSSAGKTVLGQLALSVKNPGESKKIYISFNSLAVQQSSVPKIALKNLVLIYDKNSNGRVDADDEQWSSEVTKETGKIVFTIDDHFIPLKINNTYSLLIVGEVTYDDTVIPENRMIVLKINDKSMIDITAKESVAIVEPDVNFPKIILIPSGNVLVVTKGEHFPSAPPWEDMTGFMPVLQIAMTPGEKDVTWSGFDVKIVENGGVSAKFGRSMPSVKIFQDTDNDGVGDKLLATLESIHEGSASVSFKSQDAPMTLKKGVAVYFVVEVDMQLYSKQYTEFTLSSVDTDAKIVGAQIVSDTFKYDCTAEDDGCRLAPGEQTSDTGGCSLLSVF